MQCRNEEESEEEMKEVPRNAKPMLGFILDLFLAHNRWRNALVLCSSSVIPGGNLSWRSCHIRAIYA
ncbi:hypothetical protein ACLKA6_011634 [Drosophila palustris]